MDPLKHAWFYDVSTNIIVATTTTVVRMYMQLSRMHEVAEPDVPLAFVVIPEALLGQPLSPWDFPLSSLLDIDMEPMYPELPSIEIQPRQ